MMLMLGQFLPELASFSSNSLTMHSPVSFLPKADIKCCVLVHTAKEHETLFRDQDWTMPKFVRRGDQ